MSQKGFNEPVSAEKSTPHITLGGQTEESLLLVSDQDNTQARRLQCGKGIPQCRRPRETHPLPINRVLTTH